MHGKSWCLGSFESLSWQQKEHFGMAHPDNSQNISSRMDPRIVRGFPWISQRCWWGFPIVWWDRRGAGHSPPGQICYPLTDPICFSALAWQDVPHAKWQFVISDTHTHTRIHVYACIYIIYIIIIYNIYIIYIYIIYIYIILYIIYIIYRYTHTCIHRPCFFWLDIFRLSIYIYHIYLDATWWLHCFNGVMIPKEGKNTASSAPSDHPVLTHCDNCPSERFTLT